MDDDDTPGQPEAADEAASTGLIIPIAQFRAEVKQSITSPIIPGVAYEGSGLMLYGRQGLGKTRLCLQLAHALMSGDPWLGIIPIERTGPVVYLQLDMAPAEWDLVLEEASEAGLDLSGLHALRPDVGLVDVLHDRTHKRLCEDSRALEPIALVIDGGYDVFQTGRSSGDVNQLIRKVLHRLRECVPHGVLIYLLHDRKYPNHVDSEGDPDAFSGPGAWEQFASTSLRIVRGKDLQLKLAVRKTRFLGLGFDELKLKMNGSGFLEPELDPKSMLAIWPDCVPVGEREVLLVRIESKADVYRDIAERADVKFDAVKKHADRHGPYAWMDTIGNGS